MTRRIVSGLIVLFLVVMGLLPLLVMFGQSLIVHGRLSTEFYQAALVSARTWVLLGHSVSLALLTTLFAVALGVPLGLLLGKTDLPYRTLLMALFTIPLLVPPYIMAVSWSYALGRAGLVAGWLGVPMAQQTSAWLFGLPGCVLVLGSTFLPIVMFLTMTSLQSVNPRLEEAGRLVAGWVGVLKGISLPTALPGILLSAILVFLLSLGEFSVPTFLRYPVFSVESFTQFTAFHEVGAATASATFLVLIALLILVVERQYVRQPLAALQPPADRAETVPVALGPLRAWWCVLVCLLCGVLVVVPLLVLVLQSASLTAYVEACSRAGDSLLRSVAYAALGASCLTMLGFFLGYFLARRRLPFWQALDFLTIALVTLPSTVIGVALVTLWNRPATTFIYATPLIVLFGYLAQYTALTSRITVATLSRIPASMEEAAQVAGAGWLRRVGYILAPLAKRGLVAGWLVSYLFCLRDTGITMMVYPPGGDTLPVRTFTLMANSPPHLIAALCLIMVVATLIPLGLLHGVVRPMRAVR